MTKYHENDTSYPIAAHTKHAVHLLKGKAVKAAITTGKNYALSPSGIEDQGSDKLAEWWTSTQDPKYKYISPGQTTYVASIDDKKRLEQLGQKPKLLNPASVKNELNAAGFVVTPETVNELHSKTLRVISDFSDIFENYVGISRQNFVMRAWQIYAPIGALGRTPFFHIDHSILTGMWYPYEGRATAEAYTGDVPKDVWAALQPSKQTRQRGKLTKKDHQNIQLIKEFTASAQQDELMSLPSGALIAAKNLKSADGRTKFRDLMDEKVQQSVLLHKSGDVKSLGQIGLIMTPHIFK